MCSESHYCTLAEYIICALPSQAVTSQRGCRVPGNHYQPLMILSKLEHSWHGGGRGFIPAATTLRALRAHGSPGQDCSSMNSPLGDGLRDAEAMGTLHGPGSHYGDQGWHPGQGHLHLPHKEPSPAGSAHRTPPQGDTSDPKHCSALSLAGGTTKKPRVVFFGV